MSCYSYVVSCSGRCTRQMHACREHASSRAHMIYCSFCHVLEDNGGQLLRRLAPLDLHLLLLLLRLVRHLARPLVVGVQRGTTAARRPRRGPRTPRDTASGSLLLAAAAADRSPRALAIRRALHGRAAAPAARCTGPRALVGGLQSCLATGATARSPGPRTFVVRLQGCLPTARGTRRRPSATATAAAGTPAGRRFILTEVAAAAGSLGLLLEFLPRVRPNEGV